MFKVGDNVVCVYIDKDYSNYITIGKKYKVLNHNNFSAHGLIYTTTDIKNLNLYFIEDWFMKLSDIRKNKLDKISNSIV